MISAEERVGDLFEVSAQKIAASSHWLELAVSWTYWMSEFTVLGLALLCVYLRRNEHFRNFRNWVLLSGVIGFVGYVVYPTAPPRMFPTDGFVDTLPAVRVASTTGAASSSWRRTSTPRCRACTRPTR